MKRGIVLMVMLLLLVDLADDGYLGDVKTGAPLQAVVSHGLSHFHHSPSRQDDSSKLLPSSDWRDIFISWQAEPVIPLGQLPVKIITSCNHGGSGGIPQ
jgi:hypothetical protein